MWNANHVIKLIVSKSTSDILSMSFDKMLSDLIKYKKNLLNVKPSQVI